MKEDPTIRRVVTQWAEACSFKLLLILSALLICLTAHNPANAQTCSWHSVFSSGETIDYDIYFKWGLVTSKAGAARFSVRSDSYKSAGAWEYKLLFRSHGMVETFYKMRDTITVYFSQENKLLFSSKHTDEGGFFLLDELSFDYKGDSASVRSFRRSRNGIRIDTTLNTIGCVYDMLGTVMYLRSIDWRGLEKGNIYSFKVIVGKDVVNVNFRYTGRETVKLSEAMKFNTNHFFIDVYDPAFTQSKEAAEVWVSDDSNRIPIRVRAKLKVGAADVYYKESASLRHSLGSLLRK